MKANPEKFQAMVMSRRVCNLDFNVNDITISTTGCSKLLGVLIDKDLKFSDQVKHVTVKSSRQVNALGRLRKILCTDSKLTIVKSFIMSNFKYCNSILYHTGVSDVRKWNMLSKEL